MIICAAIKIKGVNIDTEEIDAVVCGLRHRDCYKVIKDFRLIRKTEEVEGFITDENEFLSRRSAFIHACQCGQLSQTTKWYKQDNNIDELESEDLY